MTVSAYRADGSLAATTTVADDGSFVLPNVFPDQCEFVPEDELRVEFTDIPTWLKPGVAGNQSFSDVQFVPLPTTEANLALVSPSEDCCEVHPDFGVPCFANGDQVTVTPGEPYPTTMLYRTTDMTSTAYTPIATAEETGTVWGIGFERFTQTVFSAAFLKRHTGTLPADGLDAIYKTAKDGSGTGLFVNVGSIGINVGSEPTNRGLGDLLGPSRDVDTFTLTGKVGMGDIDYDESTNSMYIVNLFDRSLYAIDNINPSVPPSSTDVEGPWLINDGITCSNGELRPFGIRLYEGFLYATGTCTGENAGSTKDDLALHIFRMDIENRAAGFTQVLSTALNYNRVTFAGPLEWRTWLYCDTYLAARYERPCVHPHASNIDFDKDGSMIIAIMDRNGNKGGPRNYPPVDDPSLGIVEDRDEGAMGDLVRACYVGGAFYFEGEPECPNNNPQTGSNYDVNLHGPAGPGGGEYYVGDYGPFNINQWGETAMGAAIYARDDEEVIAIAMDPESFHSGGLIWLENAQGQRQGGINLYQNDEFGTGTEATFGKANGLGDLELFCQGHGVQVGNRVWSDDNNNGIQDPAEPGLSGVTIQLWKDGIEIASTTTDANGNYYFSGLDAFTDYRLSVSEGQGALSGYSASGVNIGSNDAIDSDGVVTAGVAEVDFTTGADNHNDHSFDFGFTVV